MAREKLISCGWYCSGYSISAGLSLLLNFKEDILKTDETNLTYFQILGICFAQNLRADIFAQMAKWGRRGTPVTV